MCFDVGDETLWNPSNGAGRLFVRQVEVFDVGTGALRGDRGDGGRARAARRLPAGPPGTPKPPARSSGRGLREGRNDQVRSSTSPAPAPARS
ncbi:DUF6086 family protein [Streptomyces tibetensis]|uniref:DUF6086 family protein n=1 Tax=Streptomyces tibetensis TaxID=2382123 RepID=UPI003F53F6F3